MDDTVDIATKQDPTRRAWFEGALPLATAAFLNEMGREHFWSNLAGLTTGQITGQSAAMHFLNDGTVLVGNRGLISQNAIINEFRKSDSPHNRQLIILISNSKQ